MKAIAAVGRSKCTLKELSIYVEQLEKFVDHCKQTYKESEAWVGLSSCSVTK